MPEAAHALADDMTPSPAMARAFDLLEAAARNVFISGRAGTGKSTFLNWYRTQSKRNIVTVAPTGVAALNVGGQTIHSFFNIRPGLVDLATFKPRRNKSLYKDIDLLVIDEISMVRADLFDAIDMTLRTNNNPGLPFGGVQVCVIGDLFQLPPVVSPAEKRAFEQYYASPYFFSSQMFDAADFEVVPFQTVFRQQEGEFITLLNRIRVGDRRHETLAALNQRHQAQYTPHANAVTLTTTNAAADMVNGAALDAITGPATLYRGEIKGGFKLDQGNLPAPMNLELKTGAQVMFTRNDVVKRRWVNGTVGIVSSLGDDAVEVAIATKTGVRKHVVGKETWTAYTYEPNATTGKLVQKENGSYVQLPLMLAWAVTIHKSQGKTLDHVVLDLGRGAFAPGQLYVALSRCRTMEGLILKRPIRPGDVLCDPEILAFVKKYGPRVKTTGQ